MKHKKIASILFFIILGVGFVLGSMLPLRPEVSEIEQRTLTAFPEFTLSEFADGTYFANVTLWYADSYPGRETMIAADHKVKSLYGMKDEAVMIGSAVAADEIPDFEDKTVNITENGTAEMVDIKTVSSVDISEVSEEDSASGNAISENDVVDISIANEGNIISENRVDINVTEEEELQQKEAVEPPKANALEAEIRQNIQQNLYVKDGAAYSAYYFTLGSAERYINAMNLAAEELDGICDVYSILVPNQSGAMLPEKELSGMGGSDQIGTIHYYYSRYENVKTVDTIDTLRAHNDEYLYFRTDHHWTSLGAYYVYLNFCKEKGIASHELDYFEHKRFEPFLGSFYTQLQSPEMAANPDYVDAYIPRGTNDLRYWKGDGGVVDWSVVRDVSGWNAYSKYCCFIGGDKPLAIIENPQIHDGSSCLVIKESYGNCFVPFLVDHYQTVNIMDYRYANRNAIQYIKENNVQDLIMINNITIIGSGGVLSKIESLLKE